MTFTHVQITYNSITSPASRLWEKNHPRDVLEDSWLLQTLAVFGSISLTGVLITLLACFNNTPILKWNGISLNATVAVIDSQKPDRIYRIWLFRASKMDLIFMTTTIIERFCFYWSEKPRSHWKYKIFVTVHDSFIYQFRCICNQFFFVFMNSFVQLTIGKSNVMIYKNDSFTQISYARRYSKGTFEKIPVWDQWDVNETGEFMISFCRTESYSIMSTATAQRQLSVTQLTRTLQWNQPSILAWLNGIFRWLNRHNICVLLATALGIPFNLRRFVAPVRHFWLIE